MTHWPQHDRVSHTQPEMLIALSSLAPSPPLPPQRVIMLTPLTQPHLDAVQTPDVPPISVGLGNVSRTERSVSAGSAQSGGLPPTRVRCRS